MKVMVTGANGFLGQNACLFLANRGFEVYAVSRNECRIPFHQHIYYHAVELTNVSVLQKLVAKIKPEVIIHKAAQLLNYEPVFFEAGVRLSF